MPLVFLFLILVGLPGVVLGNSSQPDTTASLPASAPLDYETQSSLARSLAYAGDYDEAEAIYDSLLTHHPGNPDLLLGRGLTRAWAGKYAAAEEDFNDVLLTAPEYADAWAARGSLMLWTGRPDLALKDHRKWAKLKPESPDPQIALVRDLIALRQFPSARSHLRKATQLGASSDAISLLLQQLNRVPPASLWELRGGLSYLTQERSDSLPSPAPNTTASASIRRKLENGSVALVFLESSNGIDNQHGFQVDYWRDLWQGAYGNASMTKPDVSASLLEMVLLTDVYQTLGAGFEASLGIRGYLGTYSSLYLLNGGLGYYIGNWYLNGRVGTALGQTNETTAYSLQIRRYLGNVDRYIDVTGTNEQYQRWPVTKDENTKSYGALIHWYFGTVFGLEAIYNRIDYAVPLSTENFQASLLLRW